MNGNVTKVPYLLEVPNAVFRIIFREMGSNIIIKLNAIMPSTSDPNFISFLIKEGELRLRKVFLNSSLIRRVCPVNLYRRKSW